MDEECFVYCIDILGLKEAYFSEFIKDRVFTGEIFNYLLKSFGKYFVFAYKRFGEGRSKVIYIVDEESGVEGKLYTYLGIHAEYIIILEAPYCGCMSRYPMALEKRVICPHIIGFCLDCLFDSIRKYVINDFSFSEAFGMIYKAMFE